MPVEYGQLLTKAVPFELCPKCGQEFVPFMRGLVQDWWPKLWRKPYCALICSECKEVVGYEKP